MHEAARLLSHRLHHGRVAVAQLDHRDSGEKIEVLVALGIPQARALPAHELDRVAQVGAHHRARLQLLKLG